MAVEFIPNTAITSEMNNVVWNVFVDGEFTGYIHRNWLDCWCYYVNGQMRGSGWSTREELFARLTKKPFAAP